MAVTQSRFPCNGNRWMWNSTLNDVTQTHHVMITTFSAFGHPSIFIGRSGNMSDEIAAILWPLDPDIHWWAPSLSSNRLPEPHSDASATRKTYRNTSQYMGISDSKLFSDAINRFTGSPSLTNDDILWHSQAQAKSKVSLPSFICVSIRPLTPFEGSESQDSKTQMTIPS